MKILLGDNRMPVRMEVGKLIRSIPSIDAIDEASDGIDLLSKANAGRYDLIIMDTAMNGLSGLEFLRIMRKSKNKTHVLLYGDLYQKQNPVQALMNGASGFLVLSCIRKELLIAVRRIMHGELYVSA